MYISNRYIILKFFSTIILYGFNKEIIMVSINNNSGIIIGTKFSIFLVYIIILVNIIFQNGINIIIILKFQMDIYNNKYRLYNIQFRKSIFISILKSYYVYKKIMILIKYFIEN